MNLSKSIFVLLLFSAFTIALTSCGNKSKSESPKTEVNAEKSGKEYTSAYICPMHCKGSGSDKAGTCPVCKMDYKKNKDHNHDGHDHSGHDHDHHNHDGHDHSGHNH